MLTHDFSLAFVADNNSRETPLLYSITGMWSALQGSILLWALILAGYVVAMTHWFRKRASDPLVAWASLVALCVAVFFFALMAGPANPFADRRATSRPTALARTRSCRTTRSLRSIRSFCTSASSASPFPSPSPSPRS